LERVIAMDPFDIITAPVLGPVQVLQRLGRKVLDFTMSSAYDETQLLEEIVRLQVRYDMGRISTETFYRRHRALVRQANMIRKAVSDAGDQSKLPG